MRAARAAAGVNMDVTVAKTAGFCFGVKRAVEKVYEQIEKGKTPIYTFGPIIHNEEAVSYTHLMCIRDRPCRRF